MARLTPATVAGLDALAGLGRRRAGPGERGVAGGVEGRPGAGSAATALRAEIAKLERVRAHRAAGRACSTAGRTRWSPPGGPGRPSEYPSDLRAHDPAVRLTLLATLAWISAG